MIKQSLKMIDLGVTFDQLLNFDDHNTAICRSIYFYIRNSRVIIGMCYRKMLVLLIDCEYLGINTRAENILNPV